VCPTSVERGSRGKRLDEIELGDELAKFTEEASRWNVVVAIVFALLGIKKEDEPRLIFHHRGERRPTVRQDLIIWKAPKVLRYPFAYVAVEGVDDVISKFFVLEQVVDVMEQVLGVCHFALPAALSAVPEESGAMDVLPLRPDPFVDGLQQSVDWRSRGLFAIAAGLIIGAGRD